MQGWQPAFSDGSDCRPSGRHCLSTCTRSMHFPSLQPEQRELHHKLRCQGIQRDTCQVYIYIYMHMRMTISLYIYIYIYAGLGFSRIYVQHRCWDFHEAARVNREHAMYMHIRSQPPPPHPDSSVRTHDFPLLSVCEDTAGKSVGPLGHERNFCKKCRTSIGPRRDSDDIADYATDARAVGKEVRTRQGFMTSV